MKKIFSKILGQKEKQHIPIDANLRNTSNFPAVFVSKDEDIIRIDIREDITLENYISAIHNIFPEQLKNKININIVLEEGSKVPKQILYIIENNQTLYNISIQNLRIYLFEQQKENMNVKERLLMIDKSHGNYQIMTVDYDSHDNYQYKREFCFDSNDINHSICKGFLNRGQALLEARKLLQNLKQIPLFHKIQSVNWYYSSLYIVEENDYYPVIENDILALSWQFFSICENQDIYQNKMETLAIILKETMEKVGTISYDFLCSSGFTYDGNIGYDILPPFRNQHYATMALGLLNDLLKDNTFSGDKDLYISTLPDNYYSQKVALNNGGELYYEGNVPKEDSLYYVDGIKKVKVFKIKM